MRIDQFWKTFLNTLAPNDPTREKNYQSWCFCNNQEDANTCSELVVKGIKKATASLLWEYEHENEPLPQAGDIDIITDWDNNPVCIIETIEVTITPFNQVDAKFATDEGEGDKSLQFWRDVHWKAFSESCKAIQRTPTQEMPVVCARFKMIFKH